MKCLRRRRISDKVHRIVVYTESDQTTMKSIVSVLRRLRCLYDLIQIMNIIILKMWSVLISKSLKVLLWDPSDENVTLVVEELRRQLKPMMQIVKTEDQREEKDSNVQHDIETTEEDESPFEFRALEVALEAICSYLAARTLESETVVYPALDMLTSKVAALLR